jgi:hypothetical protein
VAHIRYIKYFHRVEEIPLSDKITIFYDCATAEGVSRDSAMPHVITSNLQLQLRRAHFQKFVHFSLFASPFRLKLLNLIGNMARHSSESNETESEHDAGDLVDIEADEDSSDEDPEHNADDGAEFTLFMELPPELRLRIWQLFCPDLMSKSRFVPVPATFAAFDTSPQAMALPAQTESIRMLSAVHRDTRKLVVSAYPNILPMRRDGQLRFSADRDVAYIEIGGDNEEETDWLLVRRVLGQVSRVCLSSDALIAHSERFEEALSAAARLEKLFLFTEGTCSQSYNWCGSPLIHHTVVGTHETSANLGEDLRWIYVWPDLERHRDFATIHVGRVDESKSLIPEDLWSLFSEMGIEVWPLVLWEFEHMEHYFFLVEKYDAGQLEDLPSSDDEDDTNEVEVDESSSGYESTGIDDAEIISVHSPSEDEFVPNAPITLDTSPPASVDHDAGDARFSSVEVDSAEEEEPPGELTARRPKRHISSDSDDESGSEQPVTKRQRTRPAVVSDSSSEDDNKDSDADEGAVETSRDTSQPARSRRLAQVISSDTESSNSEKNDEDRSDDGEHLSQSGSDDTEGNSPRRLTLAERLQQNRTRYPDRKAAGRGRALIEDDGSEESNSEDDDNEEDESEEDSEEEEDGLIDGMAEDSDGEGEEEDDEEGW